MSRSRIPLPRPPATVAFPRWPGIITFASRALPQNCPRASKFPWTMYCWAIAKKETSMTTTGTGTPIPVEDGTTEDDLDNAIRDYVLTYALGHGRPQAARHFGVSRHTLWRFMERGHPGRTLPKAVVETIGDNPDAIATAAWAMTASRQVLRTTAGSRPLAETLEDTLRLLCAAPLAMVEELSAFGRIPATSLRRRLSKLAELGLVDSVSHHLGNLGPNPRHRHFPTERGIEAAAEAEHGTGRFLGEYPVSREWLRLLTERLDAVPLLYHVAAMIARADPEDQPVRVDHHRQEPYDLLITLSGGRSLGIVRQGPVLSSADLRYRLITLEQLRYYRGPPAGGVGQISAIRPDRPTGWCRACWPPSGISRCRDNYADSTTTTSCCSTTWDTCPRVLRSPRCSSRSSPNATKGAPWASPPTWSSPSGSTSSPTPWPRRRPSTGWSTTRSS